MEDISISGKGSANEVNFVMIMEKSCREAPMVDGVPQTGERRKAKPGRASCRRAWEHHRFGRKLFFLAGK